MKCFKYATIQTRNAMKPKTIIIVTGCSGSGKSTALATFEDAGFFCVDNLPAGLMPHFIRQTDEQAQKGATWPDGRLAWTCATRVSWRAMQA
jgi:RNase adaptor protein for sRNA GlmZ degradation